MRQTVEHLFRHRWGKLVSGYSPNSLVRRTCSSPKGVVQDTLEKRCALEDRGCPTIHRPGGWLPAIKRLMLRRRKGPCVARESSTTPVGVFLCSYGTRNGTEPAINDDQLRMMFVVLLIIGAFGRGAGCTHPQKTLCGFSVTEIAKSFLTGYGTIEKRLYRA